MLRVLDSKFRDLNSYQELVNESIFEAVGTNRSLREVFQKVEGQGSVAASAMKRREAKPYLPDIVQEPISSLDAA